MRIALVSPMPPSKSGIADYSAALAGPLSELADVAVISCEDGHFDPARFDALVYQLGNNPYHSFVYDLALNYPGVAVLHEPNLHHLIVDRTIVRGDWDGYLKEAEYDGGPAALARARRARALETGPDYDGVPMIRRLLERSRAVVVHSHYVEEAVRQAGFAGPVGCIPHGAWIPQVDRMVYRHRLGLDETAPLVGVFGFLKPYKRIAESLRAFRRLVRLEPTAKMILVGEAHPDFPVTPLINRLGLRANVRMLGFTPIDDFAGYMAACDVVLNLRYPTLGESSGSLLRALGLGRAVVVSDVGSFRELPDDICLKTPAGDGEEETLFEFLNLLVSRPSFARGMGERARQWVERECRWEHVAQRYAAFLADVAAGRTSAPLPERAPAFPAAAELGTDSTAASEAKAAEPEPSAASEPVSPREPVTEEYILGWTPEGVEGRDYLETHLTRLEKTLSIIPPGGPEDRILEMGAYLQITPALRTKLGYGEVRGCYYGPIGETDHKRVTSATGEVFECVIDLFDAEKDVFPYPDRYFSTVTCCELIEHLASDPMHLMSEINRILRPGGHVVLTTPNLASLRSISALLLGYHPGLFSVYLRPSGEPPSDFRHHREYTPIEIHLLLEDAGFEVALLETGAFREAPAPGLIWVEHLLARYQLASHLRGEGIYAVGRKKRTVKNRYPGWLYSAAGA